MLRKLFADSFLYALGPQIPKFIGLFLYPLLTVHLRPEDYAISGIATSAYAGVGALRFLGLDVVMGNAFFKNQSEPAIWKKVWTTTFRFVMKWGILYSILLAAFLWYTMHGRSEGYTWKIIGILVVQSFLFDVITTFGFRHFVNSGKSATVAIISAITGTTSVVTLLISVLYFDKKYMGFFYSTFAAGLVSATIYFVLHFLKSPDYFGIKTNKADIKKYLSEGLPLIPHNYSAYLINSSDRLVMEYTKQPLNKIGLYNFGYMLGAYFDMGCEAMGLAAGRFISKLVVDKSVGSDTALRDLIFFLTLFFLGTGMLIALWSKEILTVLSSNSELENAYPYAVIIVMSYVSRPFYWLANVKLALNNNTKIIWRISFGAGILNVILNLVLMPRFGVYSAIWVTLASMLFLSFAGFLLKELRRLLLVEFYPIAWLVLVLSCTGIIYGLKDAEVLIKTAFSVFILITGLIIIVKFRSQLLYFKHLK